MNKYRRSLRLPHYNYSKAGYYFITICTQDKLHLFGEIVDGKMFLNDAGLMIEYWYRELENKFKHIRNHEMIMMPNHIHFIIEITSYHSIGGEHMIEGKHIGRPLRNKNKYAIVGADLCVRPNVGNVVQWFKTMTTNQYIKMVKNGTLPPFNKRIWQRNYWEHVVRDDVDYERIATYIINNPMTWADDRLSKNTYPENDE